MYRKTVLLFALLLLLGCNQGEDDRPAVTVIREEIEVTRVVTDIQEIEVTRVNETIVTNNITITQDLIDWQIGSVPNVPLIGVPVPTDGISITGQFDGAFVPNSAEMIDGVLMIYGAIQVNGATDAQQNQAPVNVTIEPINDTCDQVQTNSGVRSNRCIKWGSHTIDQTCYSKSDLIGILYKVGWRSPYLDQAALIARAESQGCANAVNERACGAFQLYFVAHTKTGFNSASPRYPQYNGSNCYDIETNAELALQLFNDSGQDWCIHWSTCTLLTPNATAAPQTHQISPTRTQTPTSTNTSEAPQTPSTRQPDSTISAENVIVPASTYDVTITPVVFGDVVRLELSPLSAAAKSTLGFYNCQFVRNVRNGGWLCITQNDVDLVNVPIPYEDRPFNDVLDFHPYEDSRWFDRDALAFGAFGVHYSFFELGENPFNLADNITAAWRQFGANALYYYPWNRVNWQR